MPRIFWTPKRKKRLLKQAEEMSINQLAKVHFQPTLEIERMLKQLSPGNPMIKEIRYENNTKVTVYYPAYAAGIPTQYCGGARTIY